MLFTLLNIKSVLNEKGRKKILWQETEYIIYGYLYLKKQKLFSKNRIFSIHILSAAKYIFLCSGILIQTCNE